MSRIFISYRREDSADASGRLYDRLAAEFGKEGVFKDVDNIPLGMDFRGVLREQVNQCEVMLAVIGRHWLTAADEHGRRRLENPADFVRIEIEAALERDIPVIPVLVQGAAMPRRSALPLSLAELAYRNGIAVRSDPHFHGDVNLLIGRMALLLKPKSAPPASPSRPTESVDELLAQGEALLTQKKYTQALPYFERAAHRDPRSFSAWDHAAYALNVLGRCREAVAACDRALALDPNNARVWVQKGYALNELGRYTDGLAACDRGLALDPNEPVAWNNKAEALNGLGQHQEALAAVEKALSIGESAPRWATKGQALNGLRRFDEALACVEKSLALNPNDGETWSAKAVALRGLGRTVEAKEAERRAKELRG